MRREEFLKRLESLLQDIPEEERIEAMAFYRSYFEDAGIGNEEKIFAELESPEKVAWIIKHDLGIESEEEYAAPQGSSYSQERSYAQEDPYAQNNSQTQNDAYVHNHTYVSYDEDETQNQKEKRRNGILILLAVLAVLTWPLWFGVLSGAFGTIFGLSIGLIAATIGIFVVGFILFGVGVSMLFSASVPGGVMIIGIGFFVLALAMLFLLASVWVYGKFFPWAGKCIYGFCKGFFDRNKKEGAL